MPKNIEVELRSFISKEKHDQLIEFFKSQSRMWAYDEQESHFLDGKADVRIQRNLKGSKIAMKGGKMLSSAREESEVYFDKDDFERLCSMFSAMGYGLKAKWFRKRHTFTWKGLEVTVDDTKGFGCVIEIEQKADSMSKAYALLEVKKAFKELGVPVTSQKEFRKRYDEYTANWKELVRDE